uniref:Uncharacterized protein n=1 Tax=viral metagenome TaxID=1070528 RepID=A0A6C0C7M6_9ZZZZ
MEASILLGILGAGYLLNKNNNNNDDDDDDNNNNNNSVLTKEQAYNTDYFHDANKHEEHSNSLYDNYKTVKIPGVKNITYENIDDYLNSEDNDNSDGEFIYSNSAGAKINKDNFLVNDQGIKLEPFFSKAPPNIDLNDNRHLSRHQGGSDYIIQKREQTPFFEQYKSQNVYGQQSYTDDMKDNMYVSNKMTNVLPFEQIQVSQIDEKDPANINISRKYYENNNVDNLRTLNNQKQSYDGRILSGKGEQKQGKIGQVFKHTPETDYFNSPDKWLTTTGAYIAKSERPEQIVPNTNRQFFNKGEFGIATGGDHEAPEYRSKYATSTRQNFATDSMRNAGVKVDQSNNDTIKSSYQMYPNERDVTTLRTYDSNISTEVKDHTIGLMDGLKKTIKQTTIDSKNNGYINGGMDMPTERLYDEIKKTKKQFTSSDRNYMGPGGTEVGQPVNHDNYNNMETNATKEIIAQGRYPVPEGSKYYNSKETYNIEVKKNESDYYNHRQTHYDRMNPEYLEKDTCEFTHFKDKLNDSSIADRFSDPNLLTPFKNNPYTQSLESFAY